MILQNLPSESAHYYRKDGSPCYTIVGKNGKERAPTIREVREMGLFPSVTQILKVCANPGLDKWKRDNLLMAAATLPKIEGESAEAWIERVYQDSQVQSQQAMQTGTDIHTSLEMYYLGADYNPDHKKHVEATVKAIHEVFGEQEWKAEKSFASPLGYAGKIDLCSDSVCIDFKTTSFTEDKKDVGGYDEHLMQLSAYSAAVCKSPFRMANVYISTTVPGLVRIKEWSEDDFTHGQLMFLSLLQFWQRKNKYAAC